MSDTHMYSAMHRALYDTAARYGVRPTDVRVLLALADRNGSACTDELEADLLVANGSTIRRSVSLLRRKRMVAGGGELGRRATIRLLPKGQTAVARYRLHERVLMTEV